MFIQWQCRGFNATGIVYIEFYTPTQTGLAVQRNFSGNFPRVPFAGVDGGRTGVNFIKFGYKWQSKAPNFEEIFGSLNLGMCISVQLDRAITIKSAQFSAFMKFTPGSNFRIIYK